MIINGSDLTWEQGTILSTGSTDNTTGLVVRTTGYLPITEKVLTYLGPMKNANDVGYSSFVAQYNSSQQFIERTLIKAEAEDSGKTVQLDANCAYVRFTLGHSSTQGVNTATSEGAALQIQVGAGGMSLRSRRRVLMATNSGNITVKSGTIVFDNQNKTEIVLPVDASSATICEIDISLTKTGVYENGEIVYDDSPTLHFMQIGGLEASKNMIKTISVKSYQENTQSVILAGQTYAYGSPTANLAQVSVAGSPTFNSTDITVKTMNASRYFCKTGYYAEYSYEVRFV